MGNVSAGLTALFDSCVLYPAPLRDLLMSLATSGIFLARWSARIHEEWMRAVLESHQGNPSVTAARLEQTRQLMDENVLDCVVTGFEPLIDRVVLPDPNDRHILAAAIQGDAHVIVTFNLKHFPDAALAGYGVRAQHPDEFVLHLIELDPDAAIAAVKQHRARLKRPPMDAAAYLATLRKQGLERTAALLESQADIL